MTPDEQTVEKDAHGNEIDMSAKGAEKREFDERLLKPEDKGILHQEDMKAKTDVEGGEHATSTSIGKVVSDRESDAAGNTPEDLAKRVAERDTAPNVAVNTDDKGDDSGDK